MTTDDEPRQETNQDVFDDYVRHVLKDPASGVGNTGAAYIEGSIERIIAEIEYGEAGPETALNLIAIAHVKFMFDRVYTRYPDEPGWADRLAELHSRIEEALNLCPILLADFEPLWLTRLREWELERIASDPAENEPKQGILWSYPPLNAIEWVHLASEGYSPSVDWLASILAGQSLPDDFVGPTSLFRPDSKTIDTDYQLSEAIRDAGVDVANREQYALMALCKSWAETDNWTPSSKWHRHFLTQLIDGTLASPSEMTWDDWARALDICAWLMEDASFVDRDIHELTDEEHGHFGTSLNLPTDSKEHWAWEFGRIAALWPSVDKEMLNDLWSDLFVGWPNGLAALSVIAPHVDAASHKAESEYLWLGIGSAWGNHKEDNFGRAWPADSGNHITDLSLHWLSQLGYMDGTKKLGNRQEKKIGGPASGLVHYEPLGEPVLQDNSPAILEKFAQSLSEQIDLVDEQKEIQVRQLIYSRLGDIIEQLPEDAVDNLVKSEIAISKRVANRPERISIGYQEAVEIALEVWLPNSGGQRDWPGNSVPEWSRAIDGMSGSKEKRHRLDAELRRRFDASRAKKLGEALDVVRQLTKRERHARQGPPRPKVVREYVLGTDTRPSIFELILRFAKRIRN